MTAIVDIRYKENGAAPVKVPAGSVLYKKDQTYVFVYKPAGEQVGTIHQTPVTVKSLCSDGSILIRQGLTDGQQIVESGVHHLENGQTVRPNPAPSKSNVGGFSFSYADISSFKFLVRNGFWKMGIFKQ